jgi:hypothetical protein
MEATMMTDHDLDRALEVLKKDDGAQLGSVSRRVMAQIESEARRLRTITILSLAAVAALLAVALAIPRPGDRPPLTVSSPAPPAMALTAPAPAPLRSRFGKVLGGMKSSAAGPVVAAAPGTATTRAGATSAAKDHPPVFRAATVRERAGTQRPATAKAGPLEVRMQTDDPDVLIIWLVDGDEEEGRTL